MFVTSNRMPPNRGSRSLDGVSKLGKIRSVYCKDFVTYSECVFHPTEYLNVIIGPNGTGKSTLVSAIVLGLGGDPKILARSSSIGDYVKNGCDSAKVVVEIHGEGDETTKFQRSFDLQGKSHFAVDEHGVTQKKFLESVDIFKIQIGNLCQFLPQDRVQDFAKMNPQQILANTINSICGQDIVDNFQKLKELRNEQANGKSGYKNLVQKLEETMHRVEDKKTSEVYFCATCYNVHKWKICCDLKVVNIIQGIILKGGFPKYFCFLCNWDSRYTGNQYECKDWKAKTPELEKQLKLRNKPLIKDLDDILLPPLHMKLGIAGKFVEVVVKGIEDAYDCLKSIFPKLSEAKIRNGRIISPDIKNKVLEFFKSDDVSVNLPGKKGFISVRIADGQRQHIQNKKLILCNLKELYKTFKEEYPDYCIGFSIFASLRPQHCVLVGSSGTLRVCYTSEYQTHDVRLKLQLERYNARKDVEEKLNVCNAKKLRLEIEDIKCKITECENDVVLAKQNLVTYEREYEVVTKKQSKIDSTTSTLKKEIEEKDRNLKMADDKRSQIIKQIEHLKNKINEQKSKFEKKKRDANERQNELKHEIKMLQVYAQDLKNLSSDEISDSDREQRISECDKNIEKIKLETKRLNQEHRNIQNKIEECVPETQNLKTRLGSLENVNERKLEFLKQKFPDVYQAVMWLDENIDMFEGRVYKPIILEINVTNPDFSKYLENTINIRDLLAFSCENTTDLSLLVTELCSKRKLMVNVFHAPTPDDNIFIPRIPIENIRKYGFESYLIELVNGPRSILGYLCSLYQLQNIPFGGDKVNRCSDKIPHDIRNYYGGDLRYILSISKYGNREASLMQTAVSSKGLLSSRDEGEIEAIKNRLTELIRISDNLRNQRTSIEVQIREKEVRYREETQIKKEIQSKQIELQQKVALLGRQKQKVATLKEEIVAFPEMERELKEFGSKAVQDIILLQKSKVEALSTFQKAMNEKAFSKTKLAIFKQENEELVNLISSAREKRDSAKNRVDAISNKGNSLKRDLKLKLTESLKLTNSLEPTDKKFAHRTFYSSLPSVIEELRDVISDFSGRLDCMDDVNSEIVREYDAKRSDVESLKQEIEANLHGNENFATEIKEIYDVWHPIVSHVVAIINTHFGEFMQSMGYVGEVKLVNKEEYDFDSYGIEILVQYRKNVPLQALNRHVQSGGERAVAIAVYTLSMQHLTHVPFRCVDEINQGMDARNERKIFEMLVNETTKVGSAQYFFVTPKLLRNLTTNTRMSVHVVFNGRMVQAQEAFAII